MGLWEAIVSFTVLGIKPRASTGQKSTWPWATPPASLCEFTEAWLIPSSPSWSETLPCLSCFKHDIEAPGPSPISFWGSLSTGYPRSRNIWNQLAILSQTGHHNFLSILSDYGVYNVDRPRLGITISRSSLVTIAYITLTVNLTVHSRSSVSPMKRSALQLFHRWVDWATRRLDCK